MQNEYIDRHGKVKESLKQAIVQQTLLLPEEFGSIEREIISHIMNVIKQLPVKNAHERVEVKLHKEVMLTEEFKTLREKIKYKTYYQIDFDVEDFVKDCIRDMLTMDSIPASKIILQRVSVNIGTAGVTTQDPHRITTVDIAGYRNNLPDVVRVIEENTGLKRRTIVKILTESKRLDADFVRNPQKFIEKVIALINDKKKARIVDGIKYEKLGDEYFYTQKQFEDKEIIQCFTNNTISVDKSIYSHVIYDSDIERAFAERLSQNQDIKLFVKLPGWFKVDTPLG